MKKPNGWVIVYFSGERIVYYFDYEGKITICHALPFIAGVHCYIGGEVFATEA